MWTVHVVFETRAVDLSGTEPGSGDPSRELKAEHHIEIPKFKKAAFRAKLQPGYKYSKNSCAVS